MSGPAMAKKIKVEECKPGRFYILSGWDKLFFCLENEEGECLFQQVGSGFRVGVIGEKVKPVNIFVFSK